LLLAVTFGPHILRPFSWESAADATWQRKNAQTTFMLSLFFFAKRKVGLVCLVVWCCSLDVQHNLMTAEERMSMKFAEEDYLAARWPEQQPLTVRWRQVFLFYFETH
jgi:hypothetical protein